MKVIFLFFYYIFLINLILYFNFIILIFAILIIYLCFLLPFFLGVTHSTSLHDSVHYEVLLDSVVEQHLTFTVAQLE